MVLAGKLTEKLIIKTLSVSGTSYGEVISDYTPWKTVYASITTQRGNKSFDSAIQGDVYRDTISFYMRYYKLGVDKKQYRIQYNGQDYDIKNITVVQRNKAIVIDCVAVK